MFISHSLWPLLKWLNIFSCHKHGNIYVTLAIFLYLFSKPGSRWTADTQKRQKNSHPNLTGIAEPCISRLMVLAYIVSTDCGIWSSRILLTCISTQVPIRDRRLYRSLHPVIFVAVLTQCVGFDLAGTGRFQTIELFSIWWYSPKVLDGTWSSTELCTVVIAAVF